jgi:hypothetical protein
VQKAIPPLITDELTPWAALVLPCKGRRDNICDQHTVT